MSNRRMIGKTQWHQPCRYGCCVHTTPKSSAKQAERREWEKEAERDQDDD